MANRTSSQRVSDALQRFQTEPNVWIATASMAGEPHLIPLSLAWIDNTIVVATPTDSPTVRNAVTSGKARATLDSADDVVIVDAHVHVEDIDSVEPSVVEGYIGRVGWDPRKNPGSWSVLTLSPTRVQAWNSANEIEGRTIMRGGVWTSD